MPRSYQVTPEVLGRRRATQALPVRPASRHSSLESARRQPENQPQPSDVTAQTRAIFPVTGVSTCTPGRRRGCCTNPGRCRGRQRCRDRLPMDSQQSAYAAEEALSGPPPLERPTTTERFRGFVQQPPWKAALTSSPLLSADAGARRAGIARRCTTPNRLFRASDAPLCEHQTPASRITAFKVLDDS